MFASRQKDDVVLNKVRMNEGGNGKSISGVIASTVFTHRWHLPPNELEIDEGARAVDNRSRRDDAWPGDIRRGASLVELVREQGGTV
jgi:hypothetical protein